MPPENVDGSRWHGLLVYGLVCKKVFDHLFHALLSAAMGPQTLFGPGAIELLAQVFRNPAREHHLAGSA